MTLFWEKFRVLLWKNFKIKSRHWIQTVFEIIFPLLLVIGVAIYRGDSRITEHDKMIYHFQDLSHCFIEPDISIAYSPKNNVHLQEIVSKVQMNLKRIIKNKTVAVTELENSKKLDEYLYSKNPFVGIEFDDDLKDSDRIPKTLDYTLRFRGDWKTNQIQQVTPSRSPQFDGPYYRSFTTIQNVIEREFIKLVTDRHELPETFMKRWPSAKYTYDSVAKLIHTVLSILFVVAFIYAVNNMTQQIGHEKQQQLKDSLRIIGLSRYLQWLAWFVSFLILLMIIMGGMAAIFSVSFLAKNSKPIFKHSNPFLIWTFLVFYTFPMITFCFLLSTCFKKASIAANVSFILWSLSLLPYYLAENIFSQLSFARKYLLCMFPNTGLTFGFFKIFKLEIFEDGLKFENLFARDNEDQFSIADVCLAFLTSSFLFIILTLYLELASSGMFGEPTRPWWLRLENLLGRDDGNSKKIKTIIEKFHEEKENFEDEPVDKKAGIRIINLTKKFKNVTAVNNLNLNIFEDQITVLLGHNGAGKTTAMSMLCGLFPPTSGTALINGLDIRTNLEKIRESLGLCPQHNVLFDDLTVAEHIKFYARLKGMSADEAEDEVSKYVTLLGLQSKRNDLSRKLSGGQKRRLSIAIALCAKSKVVILDEPTSGLDATSRRQMWDLLIEEKKGRTILLTTHFMDEADVLGDRIAIMHGGELKTVGSPFFLKKRFGAGYRLVCVKEETCDPERITELLQNYFPDIKIDSNTETEVTYILPEPSTSLFQQIEDESENLGISSFGVSLTTMEEVFLKIGSRADASNISKPVKSTGNLDMKSRELLTGSSLMINQIIAMFRKKIFNLRLDWKSFVWNMIFTVFFILILFSAFLGIFDFEEKKNFSELKISLDSYRKPVIVMQFEERFNKTSTVYESIVQGSNREIIKLTPAENMDDFIIKKYEANFNRVHKDYTIGVTNGAMVLEILDEYRVPRNITKDSAFVAWHNGELFHSAPLALNIINRAILKESGGKDYDIIVRNNPFEARKEQASLLTSADVAEMKDIVNNLIFFITVVLYALWPSMFINFYIIERTKKVKLLQMICGMNKFVFWLVPFLVDLLIFTTIVVVILVIILSLAPNYFENFGKFFELLMFGVCFGFQLLPLIYLASNLFKTSTMGQIMSLIFGLATGPVFYVSWFFITKDLLQDVKKVKVIDMHPDIFFWLLSIFPHFAYCGLFHGHINYYMERQTPKEKDEFQRDIYTGVILMLLTGVFYFILLFAQEHNLFTWLWYQLKRPAEQTPPENPGNELDSDVKEEVSKVAAMSQKEISNHNLVLKDLTKFYGNLLAVDRLNIVVEEASCFGLLGTNGGGKTTTFKMLTGDVLISSGDAFVYGLSVKNNIDKIYKKISYCPQFDALFEDLTGGETLRMFALIRGVPRSQIDSVSKDLAESLSFTKYLDKIVKNYSGGNKRKLSTALALIGDPQIIFLDEPTTGMDAGAKRQLWNAVIQARSEGKSVVLTSHSMEECEALCTRLAIMVKGEFKCLGSIQHLKSKFSRGLVLTIKVGRNQEADDLIHIQNVKDFVKTKFLEAILRQEYLDLLVYQLTRTDIKWSEVFGIMEEAKSELNIEDYSLAQTSLEQVFLFLTKTKRLSSTI